MGDITVGEAGLINVVDFGPFLDGTRGKEVGQAIIASLRRTGFVYLVNHGLSEEKIREMFDWVGVFSNVIRNSTPNSTTTDPQSKLFFSQPMEIKQLAPHPPSGSHHRGKVSFVRFPLATFIGVSLGKRLFCTWQGEGSSPPVRSRRACTKPCKGSGCQRELRSWSRGR